jgi:hypothetical protein
MGGVRQTDVYGGMNLNMNELDSSEKSLFYTNLEELKARQESFNCYLNLDSFFQKKTYDFI